MRRLISIGVPALIIAICCFVAWANHRMNSNAVEWAKFTIATRSLIGRERGDVDRTMKAMGMHLQITAKNESEWKDALVNVSPQPPSVNAEIALKYAEEFEFATPRKCTFIYIGSDGRVWRVHPAIEFW